MNEDEMEIYVDNALKRIFKKLKENDVCKTYSQAANYVENCLWDYYPPNPKFIKKLNKRVEKSMKNRNNFVERHLLLRRIRRMYDDFNNRRDNTIVKEKQKKSSSLKNCAKNI